MSEVLRCLLEGLQWLARPERDVRVSGKSGISQARTRLGEEPVRALHRQVVGPIAQARTKGAWYRGWRLVSIDGSTWDVADTPENAGEFGRPGASRGKSGYPQLRFVTLAESGTDILFGAEVGAYATAETTLARSVLKHLTPDMLCLADRGFVGFELWRRTAETGAALLWRVRRNQVLECIERLMDGSYLSKLYANDRDRRHDRNGCLVRVVEYRLKGIEGTQELYRLVTTIIDPDRAPAAELAALYHERRDMMKSWKRPSVPVAAAQTLAPPSERSERSQSAIASSNRRHLEFTIMPIMCKSLNEPYLGYRLHVLRDAPSGAPQDEVNLFCFNQLPRPEVTGAKPRALRWRRVVG